MDKKFNELNIHQKMELLIEDMVEKEVRFRDALREFQKIFFEQAAEEAQRQQDQDGQGPRHRTGTPSTTGPNR